jgi:hypothetical protein
MTVIIIKKAATLMKIYQGTNEKERTRDIQKTIW